MKKILIYEYAENGSFDKFLCMDATVCPLTCKQKIDICIDAACGLDYLHNHAEENQRVIHRDIKSANILLDHNWKAMISDLGLSKLGRAQEYETFLITNPCGTIGYCDPMYMDTGVLTKESDVYSFGVVLFEVLCRRLCFINVNDERRFLDRLAKRYHEKGKLNEIIDPVMKEQLPSSSLNKISEVAYQCLHVDREKRPSMCLVVKKLKQSLKLQEFIDGSPMNFEEISRISCSPLLEYNSDEEDLTSLHKLQAEAKKATRMNDEPYLEPGDFMKLLAKGTNKLHFTSISDRPSTSQNSTSTSQPEKSKATGSKVLNKSPMRF